jgi:hypothetical protein
MMLTEPYHYCGNNPTAKAVGRVVSEVAADDLVSQLEFALRRLRTDPANVSPAIAELASCTLPSLTRIRIEERLAKVSGHVAREFRLPLEELQSRSREQRITFARQLAMFVCREITLLRSGSSASTSIVIIAPQFTRIGSSSGDWRVSRGSGC